MSCWFSVQIQWQCGLWMTSATKDSLYWASWSGQMVQIVWHERWQGVSGKKTGCHLPAISSSVFNLLMALLPSYSCHLLPNSPFNLKKIIWRYRRMHSIAVKYIYHLWVISCRSQTPCCLVTHVNSCQIHLLNLRIEIDVNYVKHAYVALQSNTFITLGKHIIMGRQLVGRSQTPAA